jgi:hypothetical protein
MIWTLEAKILAGLILLAAISGSLALWTEHERGIGDARTAARYEKALAIQKADAAKKLADAVASAAAAEKTLQDFKNKQEKDDAEHQQTVSNLSEQVRILAGNAGRLRDPNAGRGHSCSGSASTAPATPAAGTADTTETDGLFSKGATELLERLTREADEINNAYASCRADAQAVRNK